MHHVHLPLPAGHPLERGLTEVECNHCGMVYVRPVGSDAAYEEYYARLSKYECAITSSGTGLHPHEAERFRMLAERLSRHVPDRDARILDVGCAAGGLLRALKSLGYQRSCGVDPSEACTRTVREELGLDAWSGFATAIPAAVGPVQALVLSHVLEHLTDPGSALDHLLDNLTTDGIVYIEVPDAERYADFIVSPFQDFNPEHINHFSPPTLGVLLARHGLAPVEQGRGVLDLLGGQRFPVIHVVARRQRPLFAGDPVRDPILGAKIREYIRESGRILEAIEAVVAPFVASREPLIVWGAGSLAVRLLACTGLDRANIVAFADSNPVNQGQTLVGIPILAPAALAGIEGTILVASTIHEDAIRKDIRARWKLPNPILGLREVVQMSKRETRWDE